MSNSESDTMRQRFVQRDDRDTAHQDKSEQNQMPEKQSTWWFATVFKIMTCIVCGVIFGFAAEKGRVTDPRAIRYQMIFKQMVMMKMFLSALAAGMFGLALLAMFPATSNKFFQSCMSYYKGLTDKGILACAIGGTILGTGMTVAGSCPTMIFSQIGAMVPNVEYTVAGAFFGTFLYGFLKPLIDKVTKPVITESSNPWNNSPYFIMALPIAVMFGMIVSSIEILYPWTRDVKDVKEMVDWSDILTMKAWPPFVSGIVMGSLQLPLVLVLGETLGGSSSFITILAQVFVGPLKRISPFICRYRFGLEHWWQIYYIGGAMLGAYLSASSSGYVGKSPGVPALHAFIGGSMMLFGARVAGGCTSGHGLSGMSLLSILAVITVACMFTAAIATGLIMNYYKMLRI